MADKNEGRNAYEKQSGPKEGSTERPQKRWLQPIRWLSTATYKSPRRSIKCLNQGETVNIRDMESPFVSVKSIVLVSRTWKHDLCIHLEPLLDDQGTDYTNRTASETMQSISL